MWNGLHPCWRSHMRRLLLFGVLILLGGFTDLFAQASQTDPSSQNPVGTTGQPADPGAAAPDPAATKPDPQATKPDPQAPRHAPQTPVVRTGSVSVSDKVTIGGYGSVRFETNSLKEPKPAGFDFRRFVLTTDATPNDRLQAYIEVEFERLAEIEVERAQERFVDGAVFAEELEGGNGGEMSIEQMWG